MTIKAPVFLMIIVILVMVIPQIVSAADTTPVNWVHPTERTDNSLILLTEIKGTWIQWADDRTLVFPNIIPVASTSTTIQGGLTDRAIVLITEDTDGRKSAPSLAFVIKASKAPPKSPTVVTAPVATDRASPIQ